MATRGRLNGPPHLISLVKHLPSANAFPFNAGESTCPLPMLPHSMPAIPRTSETSFVNHISQRHICLLETTAACDVYTIWRCKHLRNSFGFCNFTIPPASTLDTQTWPIRMEKVNLLAHWVRNHQRLQSDRGHVYGLNCRLSARKCAIWGLGTTLIRRLRGNCVATPFGERAGQCTINGIVCNINFWKRRLDLWHWILLRCRICLSKPERSSPFGCAHVRTIAKANGDGSEHMR